MIDSKTLPDRIAKVRSLLLERWDPIGVRGEPYAQDEYDSYAAELAQSIAAGASVDALQQRLTAISTLQMGLAEQSDRDRFVAEQLLLLS